MNKTIYYAHTMNLYLTPQEARDIELLEAMGFEVLNPASPEHAQGAQKLGNKMAYFIKLLIGQCDALAFRACPDGRISSGVAQEINVMLDLGRPVIELPSMINRRAMSIPETLEYLHQIGER